MYGHDNGVSLFSGWLPTTIYAVAIILLCGAVILRGVRWSVVWLPVSVLVGVGLATAAHSYMDSEGLASDPAPKLLWLWIGLTGAGLVVLVAGRRRRRRGRWMLRGAATISIVAALLSALLVVNQWVGYYPTTSVAWAALTAGPLPGQTSLSSLGGLRNTAQSTGRIVPVNVPNKASGFKHRTEYVYLPPAWFAGPTPPKLPVVMMIGGEFNTPADWLRSGDANVVADSYAKAHNGLAPVLVFIDSGGSFNNDTECVDGPRGHSASHIVDDVRPYVITTFSTLSGSQNWGIVGWSMGGTCGLDLTVMYPDLFSAFVDIGGDMGPNTGTKAQTISRLFGGNAADWNEYDPTTVMKNHGTYHGVWGAFYDTGSGFGGMRKKLGHWPGGHHKGGWKRPTVPSVTPDGFGGHAHDPDPTAEGSAQKLCATATSVGIDCAVSTLQGGHTWQSADVALQESFASLSARLFGTHFEVTPSGSAKSPTGALTSETSGR